MNTDKDIWLSYSGRKTDYQVKNPIKDLLLEVKQQIYITQEVFHIKTSNWWEILDSRKT